ncbi:MAG: GNAT family N-acetyltransferase [Gammaproteobacteria bacterium]
MRPLLIVRRADWQHDQGTISAIRRQVFIEEQHVPEALEWDGQDAGAIHLLGGFAGAPACGTVRLLADGHIGRLAVLAEKRGQGIGTALLEAIIAEAQTAGMAQVFLHAQLQAIELYEQHGFTAAGPRFMEAGIAHRLMARTLSALV